MAGLRAGSVFQFGIVPCYVVEPRDRATYGGKTLLLVPDMTGVANPENRHLADRFAWEGNFLTVMPDLFPGKAVSPAVLDRFAADAGIEVDASKIITSGDRMQAKLCCVTPQDVMVHKLMHEWWTFEAMHPPQRKIGFLVQIIAELEERHGATKVACCGIGWGAGCVLPLAQVGGVDAWAVIHAAAYTLMPLWGYYQHGDGIGVPGVIQCSDYDIDVADGMRRTLMEFAARTPRHGLDVHLYPHTYYGFFVRGDRRNQQDERDRFIATAKELVLQSTVAFLESQLSRSTAAAEAVPLTDQQRIAALEAVVQNMPRPVRRR